MMPDNRSPLMKRLAEIMPKNPEPKWEPNKLMLSIDYQPIRQSAEAFASWIGDELPANDEELRAMLWVFGEILNGEMERMLNSSHQRHMELLRTMPIPSLQISDELAEKLSTDAGIHVEAGSYQWTAGKPLKDCKKEK